MAPILPERRHAPDPGARIRLSELRAATLEAMRRGDGMNKKSARRGTEHKKPFRVASAMMPASCRCCPVRSNQYVILIKWIESCITDGYCRAWRLPSRAARRPAAAPEVASAIEAVAGSRPTASPTSCRPAAVAVTTRSRCRAACSARLPQAAWHDPDSCFRLRVRARAGRRPRPQWSLARKKVKDVFAWSLSPTVFMFSEIHAIAPGPLSRLRFVLRRCELCRKTAGNVSGLKRGGSGILRIQSIRFKDENRRKC